MEKLRLDGHVAIVTGAAQGIGREEALLLAKRGAKVVINDIKDPGPMVEEIKKLGGEAIGNNSDISEVAGAEKLVKDALDKWERLDIIINNAGIAGGTLSAPDVTARVIGVHLFGMINVLRAALPTMKAAKYGRIVNTCSGSVLGIPGTGDYASGKGGVFALTRVLANEFKETPDLDIKVNSIMPCAMSPIMPTVPDKRFQHMLETVFTSAKIAPVVVLLSHKACPSSGECIQVGGGRASRVELFTTEGYQAPNDEPTPENILEHWGKVMAGKNPQEPVGSMSDLLGRRGEKPYTTMELVKWALSDPNNPIHKQIADMQKLAEESAKAADKKKS